MFYLYTMYTEESTKIYWLIDTALVDKDTIIEKLNSPYLTLFEQQQLFALKKTYAETIAAVLAFCDQEFERVAYEHENALLIIRHALLKNFNPSSRTSFRKAKLQKISTPLLDLKNLCSVLWYSPPKPTLEYSSFEDISHVSSIEPTNEDICDVILINDKFIQLKDFMYYKGYTLTSINFNDVLTTQLHKYIFHTKVFAIHAELDRLLREKCFDASLEANISWMRAIKFLTQLKYIFDAKKAKIDTRREKIHQIREKKSPKKITEIVENIDSPLVPILNNDSFDVNKETINHNIDSPIVPILNTNSFFFKKPATFDLLLEEADIIFNLRWRNDFEKAKVIYQNILEKFPMHEDIWYVKNQIAEIDILLNFLFWTPGK